MDSGLAVPILRGAGRSSSTLTNAKRTIRESPTRSEQPRLSAERSRILQNRKTKYAKCKFRTYGLQPIPLLQLAPSFLGRQSRINDDKNIVFSKHADVTVFLRWRSIDLVFGVQISASEETAHCPARRPESRQSWMQNSVTGGDGFRRVGSHESDLKAREIRFGTGQAVSAAKIVSSALVGPISLEVPKRRR